MLASDLAKCAIFLLLGFLSGCSEHRFPNIITAGERMVHKCRYLDTISEVTDPGEIVFFANYSNPYKGELKVLRRASNMGASHIVWLYNYPIGSSASAYHCDQ